MTSRRYLLALLVVAFLVPVVLVTGSGAEILEDSTDSTIELQDGTDVDIEEGLTETQGERTLVVRLSDVEETPAMRTEGNAVGTEQRKEHAASTQQNVKQFASSHDGVEIENQFWITNAVVLTVDTDAVPVDRLARLKHVEQIHADFEVEAEATSASFAQSTGFDTQESVDTTYGVDQVNAPDAWADYNTQGEGARVAVLDTGVDVEHDDIDLYTEDENDATYPGGWAEFDSSGNLVSGSQPHDTGTHGTHVSGIVAGGNAAGTYIGVAPETELMHGLVMPDDGGSFSQILGGMEWAVENDADVMTMSLGIDGYYSSFIDPIRTAENQGTVVIASIGNSGEGSSSSPGNEYDSLGVGASDSDENIAGFSGGELIDTDSAWGSSAPSDWPDQYVVPSLAAPGSWVPSAVPGNDYQYKSGTSMAAPHVAGAAALVQSATDEHNSPDEIKDALEATAWKPGNWDESDATDSIDGQDTRYGHGIIDVHAAIDYLQGESDTDPEPTFDVTSATLDESTILEGETVTVSATVENTGDADGTFTAELYEDSVAIDTEDVSVAAGATETVTFEETYQTPGTYDLAVDDTTAGTLTVEEATAEFDVSDASLTDDTILEGDTAEVTATIANTGDAEGDFEAEFQLTDADGTVSLDSTTVTLAAGTSTTVTLAATVDESGTYDAAVSGEPAGTLQVDQPATVEITATELSEQTILEGETVTVSATVENTGDRDGSFEVDLLVDGTVSQTTTVTVAAGTTASVSFDERFDDHGSYDIGVNDETVGALTVEETSAEFDVSNVSLDPNTILEGDTAEATATVENTGTAGGEFTATFRLTDEHGDTTVHDTETVTLGAGDSTTITLVDSIDQSGTYDADVSGEPAGTLQVDQPALFELSAGSLSDDEIEAGDSVTASATVENTGDREATFTAELHVDNAREQTTDVTLAGGASETISFTYEPPASGEYTVDLVGDDNDGGETVTAAGTLSVLEPAAFEVTDSAISHTEILEGETITATATVQNTGEIEGTFTATLQVTADGTTDVHDRQDVTLAGGQSTEVSFEERFDDPGEYEIAISDAPAGTLTVTEATPEFETSGVALSEGTILEGKSVTVEATVENVGDGPGEHEATLTVNGDPVSSATITLDAGDATTVTFEETFHDTGSYGITVDDAAGETLTVEQPATFELSEATLASSEIETGESIDVTATVQNTGDRAGEYTAELSIGDSTTDVVDTATVELNPGESTELALGHTVEEAGKYDVILDDTEVGTVEVLAPADLSVVDTHLETHSIDEGETVTVTTVVENTGDLDGSMTLVVAVDDRTVAERHVTVDGGTETTEAVEYTFQEAGEYELTVNGDRVGTVDVSEPSPAAFELSNVDLEPETIIEGESIRTTATVENVGEETGTFTAELQVDTAVHASEDVPLEPGETSVIELETTIDDAGEYEVAIGETVAGTVTVEQPTTFEIADVVVDSNTVAVSDTVEVEVTVRNDGDRAGTTPVVLSNDASSVDETPVTVSGGERTTVTLIWSPNGGDLGKNTLTAETADDTDTVEVAVQPNRNNRNVVAYTDDDGVLQTDGLRDAIDDWRKDELETDLLRDVIDAWRHGEPIE